MSGPLVRDAFSKIWKENRSLRAALEAENLRALKKKSILPESMAQLREQPQVDPYVFDLQDTHDQHNLGSDGRSKLPEGSTTQTLCRCSEIIQSILGLLSDDIIDTSISAWENKLALVEADRDRLAMT